MSAEGEVSVVIPTKNESLNLVACLQSIPSEFPTFVIDSGSTDDTVDIARAHDVTVIDFEWNGHFPKKRNWFLRQGMLKTPWVLFLDADERLTDEFIEELESKLSLTKNVGFWLRYQNYFMGAPIRFGIPMRKLALFRVDAGEYERIDDVCWTSLDMEIHEHPILDGTLGEMKSEILHCDQNPLDKWIERHNAYSKWEAMRMVTERPEGKTSRQRLKYRAVESTLFPFVYFGLQYLAYGGFRDGVVGLKFAIAKSMYFAAVREKIRELRKTRPSSR